MPLLTPTPYATLADLGNYAVQPAALATLSAAQQQKQLDAANAKLDSYLGAKFKLPLTSWGADVVKAAADLAAYWLISERGFDPEDASDQVFKDRADEAIAWLTLISKGEVTPVVLDSSSGGNTPGGAFVRQATVDQQSGLFVLNKPQPRGW